MLDVEVLRSEFDAHGYDLVLTRGNVVRHIQFKTGVSAKPGHVSVSTGLLGKPSGCVLWIKISSDDLSLGPFFWFGGKPGEPLPLLDSYPQPRRATHNKDRVRPLRKNHRLVPRDAFRQLKTIDDVLDVMFGPLP